MNDPIVDLLKKFKIPFPITKNEQKIEIIDSIKGICNYQINENVRRQLMGMEMELFNTFIIHLIDRIDGERRILYKISYDNMIIPSFILPSDSMKLLSLNQKRLLINLEKFKLNLIQFTMCSELMQRTFHRSILPNSSFLHSFNEPSIPFKNSLNLMKENNEKLTIISSIQHRKGEDNESRIPYFPQFKLTTNRQTNSNDFLREYQRKTEHLSRQIEEKKKMIKVNYLELIKKRLENEYSIFVRD
ncbi:hypothetical protein SNEBB_003112 [Seison nebaliae]|nr:hypothetical protein SNEBB_003112 [Seison nebaliae]